VGPISKVKVSNLILSALLDKYERSTIFGERAQVAAQTAAQDAEQNIIPRQMRRVMLRLYDDGKSHFKLYDIENPRMRGMINHAIESLKRKNIVCFEWMRGEKDHIISRVWLNTDNVGAAYSLIGRKTKTEKKDSIACEIQGALDKVQTPWIQAFLKDALTIVASGGGIWRHLPQDKKEREDILKALFFIDAICCNTAQNNTNDTEILERVFSIRCFGDSKTFEKTVRTRLITILSNYLDAGEGDVSDDVLSGTAPDELLASLGIVKYPEQFEFCGAFSIVLDNGAVINFAPLEAGAVINSRDAIRGQFIIEQYITRLISIENRANYIDYVARQKQENDLVVYHGGMFSPAKAIFFRSLSAALPQNAPWLHWGDIDLGGFIMLARLRREINTNIKPYRMNTDELIKYHALTASFTKQYTSRLAQLKTYADLDDCFPCIDYMLHNHVKLEQEAMLVEDDALPSALPPALPPAVDKSPKECNTKVVLNKISKENKRSIT
jgi:hypothetical protein